MERSGGYTLCVNLCIYLKIFNKIIIIKPTVSLFGTLNKIYLIRINPVILRNELLLIIYEEMAIPLSSRSNFNLIGFPNY